MDFQGATLSEPRGPAQAPWWFLLGQVTAGVLLFCQVFLPWARHGSLSQSSSLDAVVLIRTGTVEELVPTGAAALLLVLPVLGLILAFLAFATRRWARNAGFVTLGLAAVVWTVLSRVLGTLEFSRWGAGGLVTMLGVALGVVICVSSLVQLVRPSRGTR